jgi:hypothetical protein
MSELQLTLSRKASSMAQYQLAWRASTKQAVVQGDDDVLPAAFTNLGTFTHNPDPEAEVYTGNRVLYHFVRDLLYAEGVYDMRAVQINLDGVMNYALQGIVIAPSTVTIAVAATQQLTITPDPVNADNADVTWESSDTDVATVSSTGLVTGVGAGTATITATADESSLIVATRLVTVTE